MRKGAVPEMYAEMAQAAGGQTLEFAGNIHDNPKSLKGSDGG